MIKDSHIPTIHWKHEKNKIRTPIIILLSERILCTIFPHGESRQEYDKACTIVVAVRDHVPVEKLNEQMTYLSERYNGRFISLNTLNIDISSQLLRKWHQEGKSLRYYVPDAVADYIDKNHIYHITEGVGHNNV